MIKPFFYASMLSSIYKGEKRSKKGEGVKEGEGVKKDERVKKGLRVKKLKLKSKGNSKNPSKNVFFIKKTYQGEQAYIL